MEKTEISGEHSDAASFQNRLIHEKSPYLLQHADNPVDWFAWGEEAFEKARREDKPIFLSIGYSTCHWCHVMEHESFEDLQIGELMNQVFISIKVDREERPDIDGVYMRAAQMLTGRGGWPLTIIMTPDKKPFFAATYIPKESRGQMTGMRDFIPMIQDVWENRRDEVLNSAEMIAAELGKKAAAGSGELPAGEIVDKTFQALQRTYDAEFGGFGRAPKFPSPHNLLFMFRYWEQTGDEQALKAALETLKAMRKGGIYDHLGGGFHRYATDRLWNVPHFEKMLYDQAMLAMAYTEAFQITGDPLFKETVHGILDYILRDMSSPEGGYYSAEDADSEGEEGKFYTWPYSELETLLSREELSLLSDTFDVTEPGNYREEATGLSTGRNILFSTDEIQPDNNAALAPLLRLLFEVREKRVHPFKDDKILTDWNGLMIAAMAKAGRILNDETYLKAAERSAVFILSGMHRPDGGLYHRYREGEKGIPGYLEDYVFFAWGLLELYESTFNVEYLRSAIELADYTSEHFWDEEGLGFYSTSDDHTELIFREKVSYDGAIPSGNSAALNLFLRLGRMTGRTDFVSRGEDIAKAFSGEIEKVPSGFTFLVSGLSQLYSSPREVIIVGEKGDPGVDQFLTVLREGYYPNAVVLLMPPGLNGEVVRELIPYLTEYAAIEGEPTVYVCSNYACELPTGDANVMKELLRKRE